MLTPNMTTELILPNIRKLFIPDPGYVIFEADLSGADAQVVAWEANDPELKQWLRDGTDMHKRHAVEIGGETEILTLDPKSHRFFVLRQSYKHATHGVHYVAGIKAIAHHPSIQWSEAKAKSYREKYFKRRPGLKLWHERTDFELQKTRTIYNKFGFRIVYFDRIEGLLPQAVAWVPQSTVAITCTKGMVQLKRTLPWVDILLQVHDSVVFQVPFRYAESYEQILRPLHIEVPYRPEPLIIPWSLSKSEKSWGDCDKVDLRGLEVKVV